MPWRDEDAIRTFSSACASYTRSDDIWSGEDFEDTVDLMDGDVTHAKLLCLLDALREKWGLPHSVSYHDLMRIGLARLG
jgi:hypothetical protein